MKSLILGVSVLFANSDMFPTEGQRFDPAIEIAMAEQAVKKLGELRGSIDHDALEVTFPVKDVPKQDFGSPGLTLPETEASTTPSSTINDNLGFDHTETGSIQSSSDAERNEIEWERFNAKGYRID